MAKKATLGSVVSIYYRGGVKGEAPADERVEGEPLVVLLGDLRLPRGIEEALIGMEEGEEKSLEVPPEMGYGSYQPALAQWYPRQMMRDGYSINVGDVMFHTNPQDGHKQPAFVTDVTADAVRIDFNHPFAGKVLDYWVKLVEVR